MIPACLYLQRLVLACLLLWLPGSAMLVENPHTTPVIFRIGVFQFNNMNSSMEDRYVLQLLKQCSALKNQPTTYDYYAVFLLFKNMQGWGLPQVAESGYHGYNKGDSGSGSNMAEFALSHRINACPGRLTSTNEGHEVLLHAALAVWPWNTYVHKNLLYYYEWHGFNGAMQALYTDALFVTRDESLLLQQIFSAPPVLFSQQQGQDMHLKLLQNTYAFLMDAEVSSRHPYQDIRELQQNVEYSGFSTGIVMDMYMKCVYRRYTPFFQYSVASLPDHPGTAAAKPPLKPATFRIGLVSEHSNNGAPDLCIVDILKQMQWTCEQEFSLNSNSQATTELSSLPCTSLDLVFFDRHDLNNDFAHIARQRASEIIVLNEFDVVASATAIREAAVDVLLYIALPTEKFTVLLSQFRLAKTQIVFGRQQLQLCYLNSGALQLMKYCLCNYCRSWTPHDLWEHAYRL